ncbi:hypothetical protein [[Scytonema hofmanni] UTEX B 1581]|uniref:hypothetical protein n=1 Tax=[Scytonema hofmanni] UTEX B 1581 TaxID=379535 RepID=UPI0004BAE3E2|nr:hypothetical protein [[Scytonema hofmanni] UTEX B 1581]
MHQPSEQLALFTFEPSQNDSLTIPRRWQKSYKAWRGEFEVIRDRTIGRSKARHFDFSIEIYDPDGNCETVVEITATLPCEAEAEFRYTVDKLEVLSLSIPCSVSESNLFIDSLTFTEVSSNTNDSLTREDSSVTESLVSDVTSKNDSLTLEDNSVRESLVSDVTSKNDSLTLEDNSVRESLVSDVTSKNDSLTAINIYKAKGTARGDRKYFRYSYKEAGRTKHLHIGGGNIHSVVARYRVQLVRDALARGQSPNEIKQLIRQLRN